mmetsp:Transcript_12640/g.28035  ORF Transcript_12640/g.28035 Transcript_12640/m.28035 type:complete len:265 (-) Transcript_12640:248-1042(-)
MASTSSMGGIVEPCKHSPSFSSKVCKKLMTSDSRWWATLYNPRSCGTLDSGASPPGVQHALLSLYCCVIFTSCCAKVTAACATATRPLKSRCPIISIGRIPFFLATYCPSTTSQYFRSRALFGTVTFLNRIQALSKSFPTVFLPMSPTSMPSTSLPPFRKSIKKPCAPYDLPPTRRSAITTALSAVAPCEIQFFSAPAVGLSRTKQSFPASYVAVVCTTMPELTPASFSVSAKHPSNPPACISANCATCSSSPMASTVPANKLY